MLTKCPFCETDDGYEFTATISGHVYTGAWGGPYKGATDDAPRYANRAPKLVTCINTECKGRVAFATAATQPEAIRDAEAS